MNNGHRPGCGSRLSFPGHVTHLVSGDLWGGAEAFVYALASEQYDRDRASVSCLVMNPGQLADLLIARGIPTTVLNESRQGFSSLLNSVMEHVKRFDSAILHGHRQKENVLALASSLRRVTRVGHVTTLHGMPEPIRGANRARLFVKNTLNYLTLRFGFDAVVAVSKDIERQLRARFPADLIRCVHNGVAIPSTKGLRSRPQSPRLRLLALGRLVPIKRYDRLALICKELQRTFGSDVQITLAGDGPLNAELTRLYEEAGVKIVMPGFVADPAKLLEDTDGLLITSDHEGIPMSVLEALAAGVPVFGFAIGGLPEIVTDGSPLHLAPPYDISALTERIARFFVVHEPGVRIPPPDAWPFLISHSANEYAALYSKVVQR